MEGKVFSTDPQKFREEISASAFAYLSSKAGSSTKVAISCSDIDADVENWCSVVYMPPRIVEPNNTVVYDDGMSIHLNIQRCGTFCCRLFGKILVASESIKLTNSNTRSLSFVNKITNESMLHSVLEWMISRRLCEGVANRKLFEGLQTSKSIERNKDKYQDVLENQNHLRKFSTCEGYLNDSCKLIRCEGCKKSYDSFKKLEYRKRKRAAKPISKFTSISQLTPEDKARRSKIMINEKTQRIRKLTKQNKKLACESGISVDIENARDWQRSLIEAIEKSGLQNDPNIGLIAEIFKVALQKENNKRVNFSPFLVTSCLWAYKKNPALYSQFRSMLGGLPCITTLKSYSKRVPLEQGINMGLISNASIIADMRGYSQADKEGTLLIDETQIKGSLVINGNGNPIGFVDFELLDLKEIFEENKNNDGGDDEPSGGDTEPSALSHLVDKTAEKLSVVMFRSLTAAFKINVGHSTTHGPIISSQVAQLIESAILHLSSFGFHVRAIQTDGGSTNYSSDISIIRQIHPLSGITSLPFIYDPSHLIKQLFAALVRETGHLLDKNGVLIDWILFRSMAEADLKNSTEFRINPKLTYAHLHPTNFDKMKVIYAVQILSRTNAKNLQRYAKECADGDNSSAKLNALADYCLLCNSFFDLLNGCHESTKKVTHMNKETYGLIKEEMLRMIVEFQHIKGLPSQLMSHIRATCFGILSIYENMSNTYGDISLRLRSFSTDSIESMFGFLKKNDANPTAINAFSKLYDFALSKPISANTTRSIPKSNVNTVVSQSPLNAQIAQKINETPRVIGDITDDQLEPVLKYIVSQEWHSQRHPLVNIILGRVNKGSLNKMLNCWYLKIKSQMLQIFQICNEFVAQKKHITFMRMLWTKHPKIFGIMKTDLHKWVTNRKFTVLDSQAESIRRIFLAQSTASPSPTELTIQDFNYVETAIDTAASLLYISMRNYQLHEMLEEKKHRFPVLTLTQIETPQNISKLYFIIGASLFAYRKKLKQYPASISRNLQFCLLQLLRVEPSHNIISDYPPAKYTLEMNKSGLYLLHPLVFEFLFRYICFFIMKECNVAAWANSSNLTDFVEEKLKSVPFAHISRLLQEKMKSDIYENQSTNYADEEAKIFKEFDGLSSHGCDFNTNFPSKIVNVDDKKFIYTLNENQRCYVNLGFGVPPSKLAPTAIRHTAPLMLEPEDKDSRATRKILLDEILKEINEKFIKHIFRYLMNTWQKEVYRKIQYEIQSEEPSKAINFSMRQTVVLPKANNKRKRNESVTNSNSDTNTNAPHKSTNNIVNKQKETTPIDPIDLLMEGTKNMEEPETEEENLTFDQIEDVLMEETVDPEVEEENTANHSGNVTQNTPETSTQQMKRRRLEKEVHEIIIQEIECEKNPIEAFELWRYYTSDLKVQGMMEQDAQRKLHRIVVEKLKGIWMQQSGNDSMVPEEWGILDEKEGTVKAIVAIIEQRVTLLAKKDPVLIRPFVNAKQPYRPSEKEAQNTGEMKLRLDTEVYYSQLSSNPKGKRKEPSSDKRKTKKTKSTAPVTIRNEKNPLEFMQRSRKEESARKPKPKNVND